MHNDPDLHLAARIRTAGGMRPRHRALVLTGCAAAALGAALPALGKDFFRTGYEGIPGSYIELTDRFYARFAAETAFDAELNPDLDNDVDDDEVAIEPEFKIGVAWEPTENIDVVVSTELSQEFILQQPGDDDPELRFKLSRAYATFRDFVPDTTFVLGRQNFVDERKWLWEEPLDGLRVLWERDRLLLDFAAARDGFTRRDLLERMTDDGGNYFWSAASYAIGDESTVTGYALFADDREDANEDQLFLGVQSLGEVGKIDYWLEAAVVTGEEDDRDVLGVGFDIGGTYVTDLPLEPSFTLGFAFGSGDDGDGTDNAFRQTGLEENKDSFNGEASFVYYGEVLDPELSNIMIATAGAGIKPTGNTSIDLVFHHYRQVEKTDELRDAGIDADPTGDSAALGNELDLVLGWEASDRIELEAAAGVFLPGDAFAEDDPAFSTSFEIKFRL